MREIISLAWIREGFGSWLDLKLVGVVSINIVVILALGCFA